MNRESRVFNGGRLVGSQREVNVCFEPVYFEPSPDPKRGAYLLTDPAVEVNFDFICETLEYGFSR